MKKYILNEDDLILYNGACCQIVTRVIRDGWYKYPPIINNSLFEKLLKLNILYTNDELIKLAESRYVVECVLYKVDIDKLREHGIITAGRMSVSCSE